MINSLSKFREAIKPMMFTTIATLMLNGYVLVKVIKNPLPEKLSIVLQYENIQRINQGVINLDGWVKYYNKTSEIPKKLVGNIGG